MSQTKKVTLSAMVAALSTVFLVIGGYLDVFDLTASALASLLVAFVHIEIGKPYDFLVWIIASVATFLFGSLLWAQYLLVFGIYPILKAYIERLPRGMWIFLKLLFINGMLWAIMAVYEFIFKIPFFVVDKLWIKMGVYLILNVGFIAYDLFITVLMRFYFERLRNRIRHLLK